MQSRLWTPERKTGYWRQRRHSQNTSSTQQGQGTATEGPRIWAVAVSRGAGHGLICRVRKVARCLVFRAPWDRCEAVMGLSVTRVDALQLLKFLKFTRSAAESHKIGNAAPHFPPWLPENGNEHGNFSQKYGKVYAGIPTKIASVNMKPFRTTVFFTDSRSASVPAQSFRFGAVCVSALFPRLEYLRGSYLLAGPSMGRGGSTHTFSVLLSGITNCFWRAACGRGSGFRAKLWPWAPVAEQGTKACVHFAIRFFLSYLSL